MDKFVVIAAVLALLVLAWRDGYDRKGVTVYVTPECAKPGGTILPPAQRTRTLKNVM